VSNGTFGYLPFGADMHEERRFGDLVIPSRVTPGWNYRQASAQRQPIPSSYGVSPTADNAGAPR
jgi:hypothetical protein